MHTATNVATLFGAKSDEPIMTECTIANRINFTYRWHKDDYIKDIQHDYGLHEDLAEKIITAAFTKAGSNTDTFDPDLITLDEWLEEYVTAECAELHKAQIHHTTTNSAQKQSRDQLNEAIDKTIRLLTRQGLSEADAHLKLKQIFEHANKANADSSYDALLKACVADLNKVVHRPKVLNFKKLEA